MSHMIRVVNPSPADKDACVHCDAFMAYLKSRGPAHVDWVLPCDCIRELRRKQERKELTRRRE